MRQTVPSRMRQTWTQSCSDLRGVGVGEPREGCDGVTAAKDLNVHQLLVGEFSLETRHLFVQTFWNK